MKESQNEAHSSDWANVHGMKRQGKELLSSSYPQDNSYYLLHCSRRK